MDRAILLLAMIEKREVDAGWIIFNNLLESAGAGRGLWYPAILTKLCVQAGVKVEKDEEKVKAGLQIQARASSDSVLHPIGTPHAAINIKEELQQINASLKQLLQFSTQQQAWNTFMEKAWKETVSSLNLPTFDAGSSPPQAKSPPKAKKPVSKKRSKTPAASSRAPPSTKGKQPIIADEKDEDEDIAEHLGGEDPLTGHFTTANLSSEDEDTD